jgi:hypothetical protein
MPWLPTTSLPDGTPVVGCPLRQVSPEALFWLRLYPAWRNGVLWRDGGYGAQPNTYIEAMEIVDQEVHRVLRETAPGTPVGGKGGVKLPF